MYKLCKLDNLTTPSVSITALSSVEKTHPKRRLLAGLQNHRTPRGQRGPNLMRRQNQRHIPRNNRRHNPNRLSKRQIHKTPRVQTRVAFVVVARFRVVVELLTYVEAVEEAGNGAAHGCGVEDGEFFVVEGAEVT